MLEKPLRYSTILYNHFWWLSIPYLRKNGINFIKLVCPRENSFFPRAFLHLPEAAPFPEKPRRPHSVCNNYT
ncbi:hypothetical protein Ethha_1068 [Ethanoligenens harbinense YUAN-3]|uniref:Uncharacterized protein n=1 Tax=Ethanoligenens harbinense (strain DSM 18485 / JCM 12961 / CGMCC 1.5033 / YUAN-3) TaxID=663278 RepID=E6U4J3_ETHHY|nr:hypothetical protein Ethha_1068 [Ethanoligenens harbinense YUAN-3]